MKRRPTKIQISLNGDRPSSIYVDGVDWTKQVSRIVIEQGSGEPEVTLTLNHVSVVGEINSTVLEKGSTDA